jgi:hypothetical protein
MGKPSTETMAELEAKIAERMKHLPKWFLTDRRPHGEAQPTSSAAVRRGRGVRARPLK